MPVYAVQVRTFELVPTDRFVWVDAPDELASFLGAGKAASAILPAHQMRQVMGATEMVPGTHPPSYVDVTVDRFGDEYEVEIL